MSVWMADASYKLLIAGFRTLRVHKEQQDLDKASKRADYDRRQKARRNAVNRMMNQGYGEMASGLRGLKLYVQWSIQKEASLISKQRGIIKRLMDSGINLMGMGLRKLVKENEIRKSAFKAKMNFLIGSLKDKEKMFVLQAYNGLKSRSLMLDGVGASNGQAKKIQLIKRLTNKPFDMQCQAFNQLLNFLKLDRIREEDQKRQDGFDRQTKERYLHRIMDSNARLMGVAFRQAGLWS